MARASAPLAILATLALVGGSAVSVVAQEDSDGGTVESPTPAASQATTPTPSAMAEATPKPSLPDDLPKRKTPDEPLFAGPATLKVSGQVGAYSWPEVLFGAQEAKVRVAMTPKGKSCAARVRLIENGEALVNEWFSVRAGEKEKHDALFDVDYLAGKVRVDSDCASWSVKFMPLEDPDLELALEELYYEVRGDTIDELVAQTEHIDGKWAALTTWHTNWVYWADAAEALGDEPASCDVTHGQTEVEASITYPRWKQPKDADPAVVKEWARFIEALQAHEQGHVTIAVQGAEAIDDLLDGGFSGATCEEAGASADAAADKLFEKYNKASKQYDNETDHGLAQGTELG